jgi:hypothetical protein
LESQAASSSDRKSRKRKKDKPDVEDVQDVQDVGEQEAKRQKSDKKRKLERLAAQQSGPDSVKGVEYSCSMFKSYYLTQSMLDSSKIPNLLSRRVRNAR